MSEAATGQVGEAQGLDGEPQLLKVVHEYVLNMSRNRLMEKLRTLQSAKTFAIKVKD